MFEVARRRNKSETRWLPSTVGNKTGQGVCSDLQEAERYGQMIILKGTVRPKQHIWTAAGMHRPRAVLGHSLEE